MTPLFARITKIDETTHTVTGRAAHETLDRDNEIFDYATSKPNFQAWSAEVFADSGGLSYGNVRSMHGNVAAGKLTDIQFDDAEKAIDVTAKIVDPDEWQKCLQGVHTGFSIGGRYAKKWSEVQNGKIVQRYTAVPSEVSLVDRPCIPTAKFFSIHKRDGSVQRRAFANTQEGNSMQMSDEMAKYLKLDHLRNTIRKIHAAGARPLPPNFVHKFTGWAGKPDRATVEIRKSQGRPLALHPMANVEVDEHQLAKMIKRGRRMQKVGFPPQSNNGQWGGSTANAGANGLFADEGTQKPQATRVAGQVIGAPSQTNMQAAVDSIKADWARGAKRMG